ncbi:hypothetical protein ACFOYW_00400 [Gryllotalpicola reticulitermitis]|uniref:ABC transporter permease n=1 Tax=Gryllotalpicola reticulitermitis TaxID=1184153 RepID=A0ABV8Q0M7_9MICO
MRSATVTIWPILIEGLVPSIPNVGKDIASWLPFDNATYFLGDSQGIPFAWNDDVAVLVLLVWAAATFAAGLLIARLRDTN